jgi:hypothetical protein
MRDGIFILLCLTSLCFVSGCGAENIAEPDEEIFKGIWQVVDYAVEECIGEWRYPVGTTRIEFSQEQLVRFQDTGYLTSAEDVSGEFERQWGEPVFVYRFTNCFNGGSQAFPLLLQFPDEIFCSFKVTTGPSPSLLFRKFTVRFQVEGGVGTAFLNDCQMRGPDYEFINRGELFLQRLPSP